MNNIVDTLDFTATPNHYVYTSINPRTFKACRTCRQQKARCHGADTPPCRRCRSTGRDCVFDVIHARKSRQPWCKPTKPPETSRSPNTQQHSLCRTVCAENTSPFPEPPISRSSQQLSLDQPIDADVTQHTSRTPCTPESVPRADELNLLKLNAPITAVGSLRPSSPSAIDASTLQSQEFCPAPHPSSSSVSHSVVEISDDGLLAADDVISSGIVSEQKARDLLHLYMGGANGFLPLFDPTIDTFEAIRERSAFCMSAILSVALQVDRSTPASDYIYRRCLARSQAIAARTMFSNSVEIEDIQGMLILATYAKENWYAVSHALEMAERIGLQRCLSLVVTLQQQQRHGAHSSISSKRKLVRMARTYFILHNVEREIASGIAQPSRLVPLNESILRFYLQTQQSLISDIRIVSSIESTQLREQLLQSLEVSKYTVSTAESILEDLQHKIECWYDHWNQIYQGRLPCNDEVTVTPENMNYASAVIGVMAIFAILNWFCHARKRYQGPRLTM